MKYSLLQMTQKVLNVMDSEDVSTLSDTVEAMQVASIIEDVYFSVIVPKQMKRHKELLKLVALSDSEHPTHFKYGANVKELEAVYYQVNDDDEEVEWREITYVEPMDFLSNLGFTTENYDIVSDVNGGTTLHIGNDTQPSYYTSFDNEHIVMNSYDNVIDSTLQEVKSRGYGTKFPTFSQTDSFVPDLDEADFPYFLAECQSACLVTLKGEANPKIEQRSRRLRYLSQSDTSRTKKDNSPRGYGR